VFNARSVPEQGALWRDRFDFEFAGEIVTLTLVPVESSYPANTLSLLLVSSRLHAIIKDLLLIVTASKSRLTLALVQITVIVALRL